MKRNDELRDIYQEESSDLEKDFTPQVSQEALDDRRRSLLRARVASGILGGLTLLFSVFLVTLVIRNFLFERTVLPSDSKQNNVVVLRRAPPKEGAWIMDYEYDEEQPIGNDSAGKKPISTKWLKKAAYHIISGQQELALQNLPNALSEFEQVIELYPNIQGLRHAIGSLYLEDGDAELAVEHLEKALLEKETFEVVNALGEAYTQNEQYEKAESSLERALELRPENPMCHKNLAELYRKMDKEEEAIFHFEKYLDLVPGDIETLQAYALYLTKIERWKEAAEFLAAFTQEVDDVAPIYFLLAQAQVKNGNSVAAIEALKSGIQLIDPRLATAWISRDDFDSLRKLKDFQALTDQLEKTSMSD